MAKRPFFTTLTGQSSDGAQTARYKKTAPESKPAGRKRAADEKTPSEKKTQRENRSSREKVYRPSASEKTRQREIRKEQKHRVYRQKQEAVRDRRQALSRGCGFRVTLAALATVLFEVLGLGLVSLRTEGVLDLQALNIAAMIAAAGFLTTIILPRIAGMDPVLLALSNFLCGLGVVILYTVSPTRGAKQVIFYLIGLAAMVVTSVLVSRIQKWRFLSFLLMLVGIGALILPLLFGQWSGGAKNWITLPFFGSFQPSEFVKLCTVITLAYYFSAHRTVIQMMPALIFSAACMLLLMLQRDLGTALIYYLTTVVLFYCACGNLPLTLIGLGGGVGASILGYRMFAHVKVRVAMWRNPWSDPLDKGYQIIQALLAIGSGGLFGVGLGQGTPTNIPAYYNDFIFAVICEQLGILFGIAVLGCYILLFLRAVSIILQTRRSFDLLLGCGVVSMLAVQTLMIVGGVIKLIPLTGVTMPMLSYGGSSLVSCLMMLGILHGIRSREQDQLEETMLNSKEVRP